MKLILNLLGYGFCILPCALSTLEHFPLWFSNRPQSLSAVALLLLLIAFIPLWRTVKKRFSSPSPWMLWLMLFVLLTLFRNIINGLWAISLVSLCGCAVGALFFACAKRFDVKKPS